MKRLPLEAKIEALRKRVPPEWRVIASAGPVERYEAIFGNTDAEERAREYVRAKFNRGSDKTRVRELEPLPYEVQVLAPVPEYPNEWITEAIGDDGEFYSAWFSGKDAQARAWEYARAKFKVVVRGWPSFPIDPQAARLAWGGKPIPDDFGEYQRLQSRIENAVKYISSKFGVTEEAARELTRRYGDDEEKLITAAETGVTHAIA